MILKTDGSFAALHVSLTCSLDEAAILTRVLDGEGLVVRGQHAVLQLQGRARVCTRVISIIIGCSLILIESDEVLLSADQHSLTWLL